jgi:hypothetical protein
MWLELMYFITNQALICFAPMMARRRVVCACLSDILTTSDCCAPFLYRSYLQPAARHRYFIMGAAQSIVLSSEGAAAATTLVIAGAVGYRISRMTKPQVEIEGKGKEGTEDEKLTPGRSRGSPDVSKARKKRSQKGAASTQGADTGTSEAGTSTAQVVPGGFDVAVATTAATKDTSKSKGKGKTKQALAASGRPGTTAQNGDGSDDDASSATPSEAPPPPVASASGSKSRKSKKRKKPAPGASSSTSILTLANASSSKATLSASNSGAVESSAALVPSPGTIDTTAARAEETNLFAPHGSKSKKPLHSGDASTTEDNEDDGKPFLASLSSSRQQTIGQSRLSLIPPKATPSSVYPDTDSSWTHVRHGGPNRRENSSSGLGQLSTSDAGVASSSVTDDGYPSSSPVAERAGDTEEDKAGEQTQGLGLRSSYVRASGDNMQKKTLAERLLPKPRKTGVEE